MRYFITRALIVVVGVSIHAGCASATHGANRFFLNREPGPLEVKVDDRQARQQAPPQPTLEETIGKVRRLMSEARPEKKNPTQTIEASDPALAAVLAVATAAPSVDSLLAVARTYHSKQVLDRAYDYYNRVLKLHPSSGEAYEGLARIWRDWNLPSLALGDAHRAIYYNPESASARNTLGTILQALGQRDQARAAYMTVLAFDPNAAYAFNNLCYLSFLSGDGERAIAECRAALRLDPTMRAAHNNLGLTFAAAGRQDLAREQFARAGHAAAAAYNMGIVNLADRRFAAAAKDFDAAQRIEPTFSEAGRRALDAHRRAVAGGHPAGDE
jgi:tetratricopeptide (TPR) repeat protein